MAYLCRQETVSELKFVTLQVFITFWPMQTLHASHLGVESCLRRARETIFWPGISNEIKEMIATCETCRKYETSNQKEPLPGTQSTMATSRSRPVRARPKAVHDNSGLLQQFLGDRPLKDHYLNQHRPKAEEPLQLPWLPRSPN